MHKIKIRKVQKAAKLDFYIIFELERPNPGVLKKNVDKLAYLKIFEFSL